MLIVQPTLMVVFSQISRGAAAARADDTKSIKGAILEWIKRDGQNVEPALSRSSKTNRGFKHEVTGSLLCPVDLDWTDPQ